MESSSHTMSRTESRSSTLTELTLRIIEGKLTGQLVKLSATRCTIGSGTHCTLRLRGKNVAAVECEISRSAESNVIRCASANTLLNGQGFESAELYNGDILTVGPITFEIIKGATAERETLRREIRSQISASILSASPSQSQATELPIEQSKIEQSNISITNRPESGESPTSPRTVNDLRSSISREEQTIADWQGFGHFTSHTLTDQSLANLLNSPYIDSSSINSIPTHLSQDNSQSPKERAAMAQDEQRNAFATQSEELTIRAIENNAKAEAIAAQIQQLAAREQENNTKAAECTAQKEALLAHIQQLQQDRARLATEQQQFRNDQQQLEAEREQLQSYFDSYESGREQLAAERRAFEEAGRKAIDDRAQWQSFVEKTRRVQQQIEDELKQRAASINSMAANLQTEKAEIEQARETLAQNLANNAQDKADAAQHHANAAQHLANAAQSETEANHWHAELALRADALSRYTITIKAKSQELDSRHHALQVQEQQLYAELSQLQVKRQELDMTLAAIQDDREQFEIERSKVTLQQSVIQDQILDQRDLVATQWANVKRGEQNTARLKTDLQKRQSELEIQYRTIEDELKDQFRARQNDFENQFSAKQAEFDRHETELAARVATINSDRQAITTREEELRQLEHALNRQASNTACTSEGITTDLLRLESERAEIRSQAAELEKMRSDAQEQVAKLESFRKAFADERLEWEEQQASWQAERIRYEEQLAAFEVEQQKIDNRFQELELESDKLEQERAEMQKIIDERNEIERESLELKQAIEILEHRRYSLDSELVEIHEKQPELEQTLAKLERATSELNEISAAAQEIQSALIATTTEYTEKQNTLQNLGSELSQLQSEIATLRAEQDRLTAENTQTQELQAAEALAQRLHAEEALTQRLKAEQALTHHPIVHVSDDRSTVHANTSEQNAAHQTTASVDEDAIFERLKNFSLLKSSASSESPHAEVESAEHEVEQEEIVEPAQSSSSSDLMNALREKFSQEAADESTSPSNAVTRHEPTSPIASQPSPSPLSADGPAIQSPKEAKADDDSIDDYMQQLLQRMRGSSDTPGNGSSPVMDRRDRDSSKKQDPQAEQRRTSDGKSADQNASANSAPPVPQPRREITKASDQNIDMSAMREIANFSARSAVNRSLSKRTASKVLQHVMVGGAALTISAIVLYLGRDGNELINTVGYCGVGLSSAWLAYALFVSRKLIFGEFTMSSLIEASGGDADDESAADEQAEVIRPMTTNVTTIQNQIEDDTSIENQAE